MTIIYLLFFKIEWIYAPSHINIKEAHIMHGFLWKNFKIPTIKYIIIISNAILIVN